MNKRGRPWMSAVISTAPERHGHRPQLLPLLLGGRLVVHDVVADGAVVVMPTEGSLKAWSSRRVGLVVLPSAMRISSVPSSYALVLQKDKTPVALDHAFYRYWEARRQTAAEAASRYVPTIQFDFNGLHLLKSAALSRRKPIAIDSRMARGR